MNAINEMRIIDSHLHLWDISRFHYPWLDNVPSIKKSFFVEDYQKETNDFAIDKMIFVQAECLPEQCIKEVEFVLEQAIKNNRIQGIVAYAPVEDHPKFKNVLRELKEIKMVKGVRRMYDDDPELCCNTSFLESVNSLPAYNLSFDISVKPHSIPATIKMIKECPHTLFILDHLGKPDIENNGIELFKKNMDKLASFPNVVAKISGLLTEAGSKWSLNSIQPYVDYAIKCFGYDRLLFGSDWPVLLLAASFNEWVSNLFQILGNTSITDLEKIFYTNAMKVYRL